MTDRHADRPQARHAGHALATIALPLVAIVLATDCSRLVDTDGLAGTRVSSECGPTMVRVTLSQGALCVDATEVTQAQFAPFVASRPDVVALAGKRCADAVGLVLSDAATTPAQDAFPVTNVTWCAAAAFCAWAGKSLCGKIGGGPLDPSLLGAASNDAWAVACSGGSALRDYPYGDAYRADACNGDDLGRRAPLPVANLPACVGGVPGLFDMSGNVWEWVDACDADSGRDDICYARGGANNCRPDELKCVARALRVARGTARPDVGFRCCARP